MSRALLNLSARPFVNLRPVVRLSLALWVAGLLLLGGNVWLYWDFLAGRGDLDARRREAGEAVAVQQRRIEALSSELAGYDLGTQNEQVVYLNQRIEQRRFSWSRLFDELADLLPQEVRLTRLQPSSEDASASRRSGRASSRSRVSASAVKQGQVVLDIEGRARNDQAILELVDALFADPDFDRPNLLQQAQEQGVIRFDLQVYYQPRPVGEPEILALEPEEESEDDPAEGGRARSTLSLGRAASSPRELR